MSANRAEVDRKIAEMMGVESTTAYRVSELGALKGTYGTYPSFSEDMNLVLAEIVPFMREQGWVFTLYAGRNADFVFPWTATFGMPSKNAERWLEVEADANNPALAVCLAALKAMEVEND